ncbi:MAG: hypothetical protein M3362_00325 [Acidobacteriota bacterium]|nr:hypothetical protein [Acidobacteriota bacterium]
MTQDRRETDKIILDRLDKLQEISTKTQINLALNTQATEGIKTHLGDINGKVQAHNASIQALQAQATVAADFILKAGKQEEKLDERKYETHDRWKWLVIGICISIGQFVVLYLLRSDTLKNIFTK